MKQTGEWGEFFPGNLSPYGYNETVAHRLFPLSKEAAVARGYRWRDETDGAQEAKQLRAESADFSESIDEVEESICERVIFCEETDKPFKIQKAEFQFYRDAGLPLPRAHPDIRYQRRLKLRNPRHLWTRSCTDCNTEIQTSFAPERRELVLCESCYLKVVR